MIFVGFFQQMIHGRLDLTLFKMTTQFFQLMWQVFDYASHNNKSGVRVSDLGWKRYTT